MKSNGSFETIYLYASNVPVCGSRTYTKNNIYLIQDVVQFLNTYRKHTENADN